MEGAEAGERDQQDRDKAEGGKRAKGAEGGDGDNEDGWHDDRAQREDAGELDHNASKSQPMSHSQSESEPNTLNRDQDAELSDHEVVPSALPLHSIPSDGSGVSRSLQWR